MRIDVQLGGDESATVAEADDLERFSVLVRGGAATDLPALDRALGALGRTEPDGDVLVAIDALRERAGRGADADWAKRFDAMVAYAATKGWVTADGTMLRAHCEQG